MKTGSFNSLQAFAAEIERRAGAKQDLIANTGKCALVVAEDRLHKSGTKPQLVIGDKQGYDINAIGHVQLAETVDIPKKYYDRMLAEDPALLAENVNTWFKLHSQKRLFRTLDGKLRAVRSDKFRTDMEYEDLAAAVLPVLMQMDVAIMSYELTETRLYMKVVSKEVERQLEARGGHFGDGKHNIVRVVSPAITISDSEVGFGSASVMVGVYDSFCSNLATFGERSMRKYHVGAKHELAAGVDYALLSDDTKQKTATATIAQISDVVKSAFDRSKFDILCDKIEETTAQKITGDVVETVKMASTRLGLNEEEGKGVLRHLIEGGDLTRFGLYNAITRQAQDVADYDRATELEQAGAKIIELPASAWINRQDQKEAA